MLVRGGTRPRYRSFSLSPWTVVNLAAAFAALGRMCKTVPLDAPWHATKAGKWDQTTLAQWLSRNVRSTAAHDLLETAIAGTYTSAASEVSLLFALHQIASGGGPGFVFGIKGGSQDSRPLGGMGAIYHKVATELGRAVHLNQPVRRVTADDDGVTVHSDDMTIRARRVIVAGGMISHAPPGVLTSCGRALRPHCGRIHWAGSER